MGVFRMACFLRYCVFGLLSLSVLTAEAARTVIVQPGELLPTYGPGIGPDAFIDSRDWNATISDQKGTRHTVPVVREKKYSWPTFRSALKNGLKLNPGQLVASGVLASALAAVDWVMSPDNTQLQRGSKSVDGYPAVESGTVYWEPLVICNYVPQDQALGKSTIVNFNGTQYVILVLPGAAPTPAGYTLGGNCTQTWNGYTHVSGVWPKSHHKPLVGPVPVTYSPVTDSDIDSFVTGFTDGSQAADIAPRILDSVPGSFDYPDSETFGGPNSIDLPGEITTTTDPTTGDTTVVESLPSIQLEYGTSPLSITSTQTTVTNTYQNGTQTSTSVSTETNTSVQTPAAEIPTDCDFMPTVCSFIDWVKTPFNEDEPDLSEFISDEDFEREINFSSNASCPGPSMIATSHGTYEFSWEPACQWAGMVKPLVIIAALIAAIFINLGMARGNE